MIFAEEMPKEVRNPLDTLSLSTNNEILYDGELYTGKIIINDISYMNLKDGHLEGKTYMAGEGVEVSFNIVNGEFDGDFIEKGELLEENTDTLINFRNGKIKTYKGSVDLLDYDLTFDSSGNANGTLKDNETGFIISYSDGVEETKSNYRSTLNTGDKGDEIIFSTFTKSGKLIFESERGDHINRDATERTLFPLIFDK